MYEIRVKGVLRDDWCDWFNGLTISHSTNDQGMNITVLSGIVDQSALQGILGRLFDLNLRLLAVTLQSDNEQVDI